MEHIAAHCEEYSRSCSKTMRTARSHTSGEYLFDFFITPSSQVMESPVNPGRFNALHCRDYQRIMDVSVDFVANQWLPGEQKDESRYF